ncbi:ribosomal protein L6 [Rickenella mellea]|uniref:Ribosomal protein L6 n=1 Tax=Rickenella mellea TaxID=50990 RepID=A0A4Y7Q4A3_9AGAM|nr:ribosomal protein L6 [Rickenella mellea]
MLPRIRVDAFKATRGFSTTACAKGHTSNIGRQPIIIPPTVSLTPTSSNVTVEGPLGVTSVPLKPFVRFSYPQANILSVAVEDPTLREQRSMWGLTRTLINNAIVGMTEGFTVPVHLVGVGYRAAIELDPRGATESMSGQRLHMRLGYSHSIYVPIPSWIKVEMPSPTKIILSCTDKHQLGLFAAQVRRWRPPEPYKGKGVFVGDERVRIKSVKKK